MKYTIITGNPVDGFRSIGIFDTSEDAVTHGDMQRLFHDYSIMEIEEIEKHTTVTRNEMIQALIDRTLEKWNSNDQKTAFLSSFLRNGYAGLEKLSDDELIERYNQL